MRENEREDYLQKVKSDDNKKRWDDIMKHEIIFELLFLSWF